MESVESMMKQTIMPEQFVLVQDGPLGEELISIIDEYTKKFPDIFTNVISEHNIGLGAALTLGLKHCRNELIARMDTDDISLSNRCELQLKAFETEPELDILGTFSSDFEGDINNIISSRVVPIEQKDIYERAKRRSPFNHVTVMFKKTSVMKFGGYANLRRSQDADLFGKMLYGGCKARNIDKVLVMVRLSPDRMKRRKSWSHAKNIIGIRKNFWKMGYASFLDFSIVFCAQIFMCLMPLWAQNIIYTKFLRKKNIKTIH